MACTDSASGWSRCEVPSLFLGLEGGPKPPLVIAGHAGHLGTGSHCSAALQVYLLLGMLTAVSSYASNYGLRSVPYPVKIICKSCKIIPVMAAGMLLQKRQYKRQEMYAALTMSIGVALFLLGSLSDIPLATGIWGVALLLASLCLDAAVANLEEKLLFRCAVPVSRPEAMAYMSASATFFSFLFVGFTGAHSLFLSGWTSLSSVLCERGILQRSICLIARIAWLPGASGKDLMDGLGCRGD